MTRPCSAGPGGPGRRSDARRRRAVGAGKINHELQGLHGKIIHAAKRRNETLRRQFTRTRGQAFPGGHAQERSIGFVSFLNRYGPGLVDHLVRDLPIDPGAHWVVTV